MSARSAQPRCILKPGKEKALWQRHPWIFSGAIEECSPCQPGQILPVFSSKGEQLASATFQPDNSLAGRVIAWGEQNPEEAVVQALRQALQLRASLRPPQTNCLRLINAEGDQLPGLIVDQYRDVLVMQIGTAGMERLKPLILRELQQQVRCRSIREKSTAPSRKAEGLPPEAVGTLVGPEVAEVEVEEYGIRYVVDLVKGQKTGFFLDQREERRRVEELARDRKVINCFSYSGGFSLFALRGGAKSVITVDVSPGAIALFERNLQLNGLQGASSQTRVADVFEFLRQDPLDCDLLILDPPAFAKRHADVPAALKGYKDLNRQAMRKLPAGSLLLTCSCSGHVTAGLFQQAIFQAAVEAHRNVRVLGKHQHAFDHPVSLFHPEGDYLKSLLLWID